MAVLSAGAVFALWFFLACVWLQVSDASHFRGGTISWKPNRDSPLKVDFQFRLAFRRSAHFCNSNTVSQRGIIGSGYWYAYDSPGYSYGIADARFHCTSFSTHEDWSAGENSFNYTFNHTGPWNVSYSSCCWISLASNGNGYWSLSTTVDLSPRRDTGKINSSPVSASSPILRLQSGCPQTVKIPVGDPDGDIVRCRWASGDNECGGECNNFKYADLDEMGCTLRYHGNGGLGFYAVTITLEDFPYGTTDFKHTRPLSQVGLQFLVQIVSSGSPCNRIPFFTGDTPSDGACVEIAVGTTYRASLVAQHMDSSRRIIEISTISPIGMALTSLRTYFNQHYEAMYRREVMWTPTPSDSGQHIFCFKATGQNGAESMSRCINFLVGSNSTPEVILDSRSPLHPTVLRGPGHINWNISFTHPIKKPRASKFIRIHLDGKEIYKIDTTSSAVEIFNRTTLNFKVPYPVLSMRGSYSITMDTGAVVGFGCSRDGPPTPGISDSRDWTFYTDGVCRRGFYLGSDLYTCIDVDECESPSAVRNKRASGSEEVEIVLDRQKRSAGCPSSQWWWGSFSSPYYPSNYRNHESCSWGITVSSGYRVKLQFHAFSTEQGYDFLSIYDGPSSSSPLSARISGYQLPCVYISSGNSLWFHFSSDSSRTRQGFHASFTAVVDHRSHAFDSYSSASQTVGLASFAAVCVPIPSSQIGVFSMMAVRGSTIQPSRTSLASSMSASANRGCQPSLSGYRGSLYSPSFPYYGNYENCYWSITVPRGYRVELYFNTFETQSGRDYLYIYDGPSSGSPMLASLSGYRNGYRYYSSGPSLSFRWYTDGSGTRRGFAASYWAIYGGWSVAVVVPVSSIQPSRTSRVSSMSASANRGCQPSLSGYSGRLYSPRYPNYYGNYENCYWRITVPRGYRVELYFSRFETESGRDYLYIYDGPSSGSPMLASLSGYRNGNLYYSSGPSLWFRWYTDGSGTRRGFAASYWAIYGGWSTNAVSVSSIQPSRTSLVSSMSASANRGCQRSLSGYSGWLYSPRYPNYYGNYENCYWRITVPGGSRIELYFKKFETQSGRDYLYIYDGPSSGSPQLASLSGYRNGYRYYSSGPSLWFRWYTDGSGTRRGFAAHYWAILGLSSAIPSSSLNIQPSKASYGFPSTASVSQGSCLHSLSGYSGSFSSRNYPYYNYPNRHDCRWTITVPYGYYVSLEFHSFSLEGASSCRYDFVEISDGWRNLGKYCGTSLPPKTSSSGNYLRVWFHTDDSKTYRGFYASFVALSQASRPPIEPTNASEIPTVKSTMAPVPTPAVRSFVLRLPANCQQRCHNYYGSYECTCDAGYELNSDKVTCHDVDECARNNGGCSHSCVNFDGGYYCACLQGQTMMADNHTCVEPGIDVQCEDEHMQISIERKHFSQLQIGRFHLRYRNCQATGLNQTHMSFRTALNDCGTTHNESESTISYWNEIQAQIVTPGGVISRMHEVSIPFYCVYSKKKLVSGASYKPRRVVFAPEAGYGNITFTVDLYTSQSYQNPHKYYPVSVKLNSDLYVGYKVLSNERSLEVFAENCWATPHTSPYSMPYYTFIQRGCLLDMSMSTGNISRSSKYFTIKAFRFFNVLDGYSTVYLHCELMACHVNTPNSRCSRGCERFRRKRRELPGSQDAQSESSKKYWLSLGPISKEKADESGSDTNLPLIVGTGAACAVALLVVVALVVMTSKYRLIRRLANRNKVGDMYAEENSRKKTYTVEQDVGEDQQAEDEL